MIRMHHVSKTYPSGSRALDDVSLHIRKGEFAVLTGPSGAGKTTLMRLIMREELPTSGSIAVNGRNLVSMSPRDVPYLRRRIGFVFQDFKLIASRTVIENLMLVLEAVGAPRARHKQRALEVLKQVSLQHKLHAYPLELSGGEQQRVSIARALINEPLILLADEPTGNLDFDLTQDILRLLKEINAHGTTVIVATHDREIVRLFGRHHIELRGGCLTEPESGKARAAAVYGAGETPP
jgi:cell division transport system ATP-binding protein